MTTTTVMTMKTCSLVPSKCTIPRDFIVSADLCPCRPATVSATATGVDEHQHGMPTAAHMNMARATGTGIPRSIQDAMIHDKNAPRSLANDFSGSKSPQWYKDLPKDQRQLFLTQRAPKNISRPRPTSTRHHDIEVTAYCGAGKSLKQLREQNIMDNKVAKLYSSAAKEHSKVAKKQSCSALMSEARAESSIASLYSAQAKKRRDEMKRKFGKKNGAPHASVPKLTAVFAVSLTMAVASLGVALSL
jgi:hypothetical protein